MILAFWLLIPAHDIPGITPSSFLNFSTSTPSFIFLRIEEEKVGGSCQRVTQKSGLVYNFKGQTSFTKKSKTSLKIALNFVNQSLVLRAIE